MNELIVWAPLTVSVCVCVYWGVGKHDVPLNTSDVKQAGFPTGAVGGIAGGVLINQPDPQVPIKSPESQHTRLCYLHSRRFSLSLRNGERCA